MPITLPTKPVTSVAWATDTNYSSGPDTGSATKVTPTSGEIQTGHLRKDRPSAQKMNYIQGSQGSWIIWAEEALDDTALWSIGVDTDISFIESDISDIEADVLTLQNDQEFYTSASLTLTSNLSGISAVSVLQLRATRLFNMWQGSIYAEVTNSSTGPKSIDISMAAVAGNLTNSRDAVGNGTVYSLGPLHDACSLFGVVSSGRMTIEWDNAETSGTSIIRANFTYYD